MTVRNQDNDPYDEAEYLCIDPDAEIKNDSKVLLLTADNQLLSVTPVDIGKPEESAVCGVIVGSWSSIFLCYIFLLFELLIHES